MIFFLEDDDSIRKLVEYALNAQNMECKGFAFPSDFWSEIGNTNPNLILLDIMLPEEDGIAVLKKLKAKEATRHIPVIMLTAKTTEYDTVLGLETGADDYIPKPFRMMELISRVRALLRRTEGQKKPQEYILGELTVSPARHVVRVDGKEVTLTLKEFELLCLLLSKQETVFSRSQLLDRIWGYEFDGESRTIDVHVRTLRQKLGSAGKYIKTVRGIGYKIGGKTV